MENFNKIEELLFDDLKYDQIPLHDIIRYFSSFESEPTNENFVAAMSFLKYFIAKYPVKCMFGKELLEVNKNPYELIIWLSKYKNEGRYNEINYGVWFEM